MRLYHFTCSDAAPLIEKCGHLLPYPQVQLDGRKLIWLTDLADATRHQLGLTSHMLTCDRMEYRAVVDTDAVRWLRYKVAMPQAVRRQACALALTPGVLPAHWWVADAAVPVTSLERA